jgi:putative MFS transporter
MVSFLLLMELTTSSYATFVGNLALIAFALGEIVITGMAYICRHWLLLKWATTLYIVALVPYLCFVPESPHWLLIKHRYDDLEKVLRQIAQCNRRSESKWLPFYRHVIDNHRNEKDMNQKNKIKLSFFAKIGRFLTHIPTMSKLFISGFLGFVTLLLYFKISYSLGAMDDIDPYLNMIIGAIVEVFGYIAAGLCMIRFGRKPVFILFLILTVICLVLTPFSFTHNYFIIILIAQLGKFSISGAVCVTYIFVPELFPTSIRGTGMGFFVLLSRLGSTIAPMIDASISHNHSLVTHMYYLYALLTVGCVLLTLLLPETRNVPLADKIDYGTTKNKKTSTNAQSMSLT